MLERLASELDVADRGLGDRRTVVREDHRGGGGRLDPGFADRQAGREVHAVSPFERRFGRREEIGGGRAGERSVQGGDGGDQALRVRVVGGGVHVGGGAGLDDLAGVHDGDAVADVFDDGEVVRDEDQREVEFVDQVGDQVEDLGSDGDVEGAHWFVGDQDAGARGQGAGDGDALALAAGELVRVAVTGIGGEADGFEQRRERALRRRDGLGRRGVRR